MMRILVLVITLFCSIECNKQIGDSCVFSRTGQNGTCKPLSQCQSAKYDLRNKKIIPQICGFSGTETVVCCPNVDRNPVNDSLPIGNGLASIAKNISEESEEEKECSYPANAITVERDQMPYKSWNKCIDLADSVFPCESSMLVGSGRWRRSNCGHEDRNFLPFVQENEFPHMAILGFEDTKMNIIAWDCDGTLISDQWVLSSAHCLYYRPTLSEVSHIRLGDIDLVTSPKPEYIFTIIQKEKHPDYMENITYNDIALLKMDRSTKFSIKIRPACLHVGNQVTDNRVIATGFRMKEYITKTDRLINVILEKFDYEQCSQKNPKQEILPDGLRNETQICYRSGDRSFSPCFRNTGGPLQIYNKGVFCTYTLIGISSVNFGCDAVKEPGIYTRVSAFVPWIESIVWPN